MSNHDTHKVYLDIVEMNASQAMRLALHKATDVPLDCHAMLDRKCIPLLQGISHQPELAKEAKDLIHHVSINGLIIICPRSA